MIVTPIESRTRIVTTEIAAAGEWFGTKCRLFKSTFTPTNNSTKADCDAAQCDFSGYAESATVVFTGPYDDGSGTIYALGGLIIFAGTAPFTVPNAVGGYYLYRTTALVAVEQFLDPITNLPSPVTVDRALAECPVIPRVSFGG